MTLSLPSGLNYVKPVQGNPETAIALIGRISRSDVDRLYERARAALLSAPQVLVCDAGALVDPDVVSVDVIARLQLMARRSGREMTLRNACPELRELLDLAGLTDVIPLSAD